jgi:hypothetical protein
MTRRREIDPGAGLAAVPLGRSVTDLLATLQNWNIWASVSFPLTGALDFDEAYRSSHGWPSLLSLAREILRDGPELACSGAGEQETAGSAGNRGL